ncbi:MAG: DUF3999 domain-containing protein [Candidatus Accumulibacter sp.]|nr:DUF3999 domain-containing protein [Accumulibacter sp.]
MKLAAALFVAGTGLAAAAENIADYPGQAEIEPEETATWYRAEIPFAVHWQAAYADLRDLRVFDAGGAPLPFALTKTDAPRAVAKRREASARLFPLYADEASPAGAAREADLVRDSGLRIRREANGAVEIEITPATQASPLPAPRKILRGWLLDASEADFAPERLILDWSGEQEGLFRFAIAASDDLEHWRDWGQGRIVQFRFDGRSITQREVPLPRRKARYLRLLWQDAAPAAAGVRGVRLSGTETGVAESAPLVWSETLAGEAVADRENEFVWHFPLALPLQRVSIVMSEPNTLASVVVSGRDFRPPAPATAERPRRKPLVTEILRGERRVRDVLRSRPRERERARARTNEIPWRTLASGVVYRLFAGTAEQTESELELPGVPVNQLRLRVDPRGGGLGAQAPLLQVALHPRELTFLARGDAPYRLGVGRAEAQAADLPLSALVPPGVEQAIASGQLGRAHIAAVDWSPVDSPPDSVPGTRGTVAKSGELGERRLGERKVALWGILLAGVLLLAGMVFSLLLKENKGGKKSR